jgi:hypothetical protein
MIGQYLPNNNETVTVAFRQKFCQLNRPWIHQDGMASLETTRSAISNCQMLTGSPWTTTTLWQRLWSIRLCACCITTRGASLTSTLLALTCYGSSDVFIFLATREAEVIKPRAENQGRGACTMVAGVSAAGMPMVVCFT